jgi:hypothetical protein
MHCYIVCGFRAQEMYAGRIFISSGFSTRPICYLAAMIRSAAVNSECVGF